MKISIIIPTYNAEKFLYQCLNSILEQTFRDFEILIIDGASTDDTIKIATSFGDSRIKALSQKDNGIYDAMNKGIKIAKGTWLYFMGSDDTLYDNNVLQKTILSFNDADIVYGNVVSTRFGGTYDGIFTAEKIKEKNICHQAIFFKKSVFKITGEFNGAYKALADWDHNLKWFLNKKIEKCYIDIVICRYADGGYSSENYDTKFHAHKRWNIIKYNKDNLGFITKLKLTSKEIKICLKNNRKTIPKILKEIYTLFV